VRAVDGKVARITVFPGVVAGAASTVAHTLLPHRSVSAGGQDLLEPTQNLTLLPY